MLTVFYAHPLADDGIKVDALAPGLRRTGLNATAAVSGGDRAEAAAGPVRLALLPDDEPTGEFFSWDAAPAPGDGRHLHPDTAERPPDLAFPGAPSCWSACGGQSYAGSGET